MNRGVAPLTILALAPLLVLVPFLATFATVPGEPGIDAVTVEVRTTSERTRYALRESVAIIAYRLGAFR